MFNFKFYADFQMKHRQIEYVFLSLLFLCLRVMINEQLEIE